MKSMRQWTQLGMIQVTRQSLCLSQLLSNVAGCNLYRRAKRGNKFLDIYTHFSSETHTFKDIIHNSTVVTCCYYYTSSTYELDY